MIVDMHVHIIPTKGIDLKVWEAFGEVVNVPKDTEIEDVVGWLKEAGIQRAVVFGQEMWRIWRCHSDEDYVLACAHKFPDFLVPMASIEPLDDAGNLNHAALVHLENAFNKWEGPWGRCRGVAMGPPYGRYRSNDSRVYPFYELVLQNDGIVIFHHSLQQSCSNMTPWRYCELSSLYDVFNDFPRLKIIVEHLAYPWTKELLFIMMQHKNLWTDLAMNFNFPTVTAWNLVIAKEYGVIDRVMYGSDWVWPEAGIFSSPHDPVKDMKRWINWLRSGLNELCENVGWPTFTEEEIDGILGNNAVRLFEL